MCSDCSSSIRSVSKWGQEIVGCCEFKAGYYCIWRFEHMALRCEEWAEVCDFRNVIRQVSHIAFNVVSERQRARNALNNLKREAPFDECRRFPWRKVYVNLSCSVYGSLMQKLLSALDYKDRETEKDMKYGRGRKHADNDDDAARHEFSLDDAKTQFRNTLITLENELCKRNEMFDRIRFEGEYELKWCVGECPVEPPEPEEPTPGNKTFGEVMDVIKESGYTPTDFSIFEPKDLVKNDFRCNRKVQQLGPGLKNVRVPPGTDKIYIFTQAEYLQCGKKDQNVEGFIYNVNTKKLVGPQDLNLLLPKGGNFGSNVKRAVSDWLQSDTSAEMVEKEDNEDGEK